MSEQNHRVVCRSCVIVVRRKVVTLRNALNDLSLVAFVAGMTSINETRQLTCGIKAFWIGDSFFINSTIELRSYAMLDCGKLLDNMFRCSFSCCRFRSEP